MTARSPQENDPRVAGGIRRYHTWPILRNQTMADHSWNVARILLAIWPDATREAMIHALFHDVGELGTGDVPGPVKRDHPGLKALVDSVEVATHLRMSIPWGLPSPAKLSELERLAVKLADIIDITEYAMSEIELGNRHAHVFVARADAWLSECVEKICLCDAGDKIAARTANYLGRRTKNHETICTGE